MFAIIKKYQQQNEKISSFSSSQSNLILKWDFKGSSRTLTKQWIKEIHDCKILLVKKQTYGCDFSFPYKTTVNYTYNEWQTQKSNSYKLPFTPPVKKVKLTLVEPNYYVFTSGFKVRQEQGTAGLQGQRATLICGAKSFFDRMRRLSPILIETQSFLSKIIFLNQCFFYIVICIIVV